MTDPRWLGIFQHSEHIPGDDQLLHLAQRRFQEQALGGEFYPASPEHLAALLEFTSDASTWTAHLPRSLNPLTPHGQEELCAYAHTAAGTLYGMVIHDTFEMADAPDLARKQLLRLAAALEAIPNAPHVWIEYAVGMPDEIFVSMHHGLATTPALAPCVDIGNVAIHDCVYQYARSHDGARVTDLTPHTPHLEKLLPEIEECVAHAPDAVLRMIRELAPLGKPLHLHMHNAHPLRDDSPYGVCDHLGFLHTIALPFRWRDQTALDGIFRPHALQRLFAGLRASFPPEQLSMMLEFHPRGERLPLTPESRELFRHWTNLTSAETMNGWIEVILTNTLLAKTLWENASQPAGSETTGKKPEQMQP